MPLRTTGKSFQIVFLLQGRNLLTDQELPRHNTTLENVDEFLKHKDSANGMNSSDEDDCCSNNEEDEGN